MESTWTLIIIQAVVGIASAGLVGLFLRGPLKYMIDRVLADIKENKESIQRCVEANKGAIDRIGRDLNEHKLYAVDNYIKGGDCKDFREARDTRGVD